MATQIYTSVSTTLTDVTVRPPFRDQRLRDAEADAPSVREPVAAAMVVEQALQGLIGHDFIYRVLI